MDELLKVVALAVLQGVTEFLPVSSSGHLVLGEALLGVSSPGATLEVVLHTGTLMSILVFYRRQLVKLVVGTLRRDAAVLRTVGRLALSALPAVGLFLAAGDALEASFDRVEFVGPALCATGLMLLSVRHRPTRSDGGSVRWGDALVIGVAQAIAMLPGISRSGSTISVARLRGVAPEAAAEFSFLMCIPLLAGATLLEGLKAVGGADRSGLSAWHAATGAVVAGCVGYVALTVLVRMLGRGRFWVFGVYCLAVGATATLVYWG